MSYKVIDNFLNNQFYEKLSYDIKGEHMPWYYTKIDVDLKKSMNNGLLLILIMVIINLCPISLMNT